jgi:flagellar biosynthesis protein FlhF
MQVHTFIADSANEAVERIRTQLGPSAVVLSVRKLPRTGLERFVKQEQIEVLAGVDEDPKQTPIAAAVDPLAEIRAEIRQLREEISRKTLSRPSTEAGAIASSKRKGGIAQVLTQTGILPAFAEAIVQELPDLEAYALSEQITAAAEVLRQRWHGEAISSEANVHVFVGVPGSGKSTVLCKMLAQTALLQGQPAAVYQLDSHVANASPLPAMYAEVVGAQFERTAPFDFERREESVYVDLPGVALNDARRLAQLKTLIGLFGVPEVHLVLNGAYESAHLLEQIRFFAGLGISGLIVTHLDEETRWGKLWNLVLGTNFSVRALGTGQNVPGDLHPADPEVILSRQFASK